MSKPEYYNQLSEQLEIGDYIAWKDDTNHPVQITAIQFCLHLFETGRKIHLFAEFDEKEIDWLVPANKNILTMI